MTTPKAGYKGAFYLDAATPVCGLASWTYSGKTRNMQDIDEFEQEIIKQLPLQIVGGDITITGNYLLAEDEGQKKLSEYFDNATPLADIRLYTDKTKTIYLTPKTGQDPAHHCIVTNTNNVGDEKSGVGTFSATLHVNGVMEQIGDSEAVAVATIGDIDASGGAIGDNDGTVTLWAELLHRGGLATNIDCYLEWGLSESNVGDNNSSGSPTPFGDGESGEFQFDVDTLKNNTTYYYRAVAEDVSPKKYYGKIKSVLIPIGEV